MDFFGQVLDLLLHVDTHLVDWAGTLGPWLYLILFAIVFSETGLVVTPFLPGDSLLFAVGALAAIDGTPLSLPVSIVLLIGAAVLGDAVNYALGYHIGPRVFRYENSWLLNKKPLLRTQEFYEKHGGKTIILARFIPIIRTFAPFVAGIGKMRYVRFSLFNITGGIAWVVCFLVGGYFFGTRPWVKSHFHVVIVAIIIISVMPIVFEYVNSRRRRKEEPAPVEVS